MEHIAIMMFLRDDSIDDYEGHALLDDAVPFLVNFLRVFDLYSRVPKVKGALPLLAGFLSYVVMLYHVFDVLPHDCD
jgi:hypothetical protein